MPGLNLNFSSLSVASNPRHRQTWMDPELWGSLPEPLLELVLAYLPLPILLQLRAVCKNWNHLLHSHTFLETQTHSSVQCPSYVLTLSEPAYSAFSFFQQGPELYYLRNSSLYCPVAKNWFNMSLDFLPFSDLYITSVGGGLLCFVGYKGSSKREVVVGVCNPSTRAWRLLPRWAESASFDLPVFVAMVVDNFTRSYRVVLVDCDRRSTRVYRSSTQLWTESEDVPTQHNFPFYDRSPTQAVLRNGLLVCATQCRTGISTFNIDAGVWESYHIFLPGLHSNVHLVQHHGRILLISRVMKQKFEGSDKVQISELDHKGLRVTKALDDVPLGPSKQFLDHFKVCDVSGLKGSDGLCFLSVITGESWMYDMAERFWRIMPSSPGSKVKSMSAYAGFSIQLRVDIQP